MAKITLGVTGGIAAYKSIDLANYLMKNGHKVSVVMTKAATRFVGKINYEALGAKAYVDADEWSNCEAIRHVALGDTDLFVVYPATANTMAKIASGIADNLLTSAVLAHDKPLMLFPAMNTKMWENRSTRHNVSHFNTHHLVVGPVEGRLACGATGNGKLMPPKQALPAVLGELHRRLDDRQHMSPVNVLVTSGGTREPIDDVRVITNISSGMLGAMLVDKLLEYGCNVWHVAPKASISPRAASYSAYRYNFVRADSVDDMYAAIEEHAPQVDRIFHSAAISDFRFRTVGFPAKLSSSNPAGFVQSLAARIEPSPKILDKIREWNPDALLVSFKFTSGKSLDDLVSTARAQLERSGSDWVLANDKVMMNTAGVHLGYLVGPQGAPQELKGKAEIVAALAAKNSKMKIIEPGD
jgi:phosphopantothenoylcysteine decarboxylase/phosphopantothenate--cysteine ligase